MAKSVVKASRNKGGFRVIIPHKIVKEMGWENVQHVTVEYNPKDFVLIRRLFSDQEEIQSAERS